MTLNGTLHEYAKALAPTSEQERMYNGIVQRLAELLHKNSRFKFQLRPAGSFVKKSGIAGKMDLDVVFLLNDLRPPFETVLSEFEDILLNNSDLEEDDILKSPYSLQFSWRYEDQEVEVDLVAAANLVPHPHSGIDNCFQQHRRTMDEIRRHRNRYGELDPFEGSRLYSGSFTEPTIEFVKAQSASVHELIRLAKLWKNSIYFQRKIFGLSSTFEAIAIYIGMEMERQQGSAFSMVDALDRFFQLMKNLKNVHIVFSREAMQQFTGCRTFYTNSDIPQGVWQRKPLLLDPADPFNNRFNVRNVDDEFFYLLSMKADESLKILNGARGWNINSSLLFNMVVKILFPGPFLLSSSQNLGNFSLIPPPTNVAISQRTNERVPKLTLVKRRNDRTHNKYADFCLKMYDLVMKSKTAFNQRSAMTTKSAFEIATEVVEHTMNRKLQNVANVNENEFDYSLDIPCDGAVLKIHFKW